MSSFGDFEDADAYDAAEVVAPEQVARRLHRLRRPLEVLAGRADPGPYEAQSAGDRADLEAAGEAVAEYVALHEPDEPDRLARWVHAWRAAGGATWEDLTDDQRAIGVHLMALVLAWLHREGPR